MVKFIFHLFLILVLTLLFSCAPVTINGNKEELKNHKEMALVEFVIKPHAKPTFPLIDAAIFNSDLDEIVADIIDYNIKNVKSFENYLGLRLNEYTDINIKYGDSLLSSEKYKALKNNVKIYNIDFDDEDFPQIIIPMNSYNFFDYLNPNCNEDNDKYYASIQDNMAKICNHLEVDGLIVGITGIFPISKPGFFTAIWSRVNNNRIYFFNKEGKLFLAAAYSAEGIDGDGDDFSNYTSAMDKFYVNEDFMLQVLFGLRENKKESKPSHKGRYRK